MYYNDIIVRKSSKTSNICFFQIVCYLNLISKHMVDYKIMIDL